MSNMADDTTPANSPLYWDRNGNPIDVHQWAALKTDTTYRTVRRDRLDNGDTIITAWLGIDQLSEPEPHIFGTIARAADGSWYDHLERFSTSERDALERHDELYRELADG